MKNLYQVKAILAGLLLSSSVVPVVTADDIEIYTQSDASVAAENPNIMFLIDTSGSMGRESFVKLAYDWTTTYTGSCASNGVYFVDDGEIPDCSTSTNYFNYSALVCERAQVAFDDDGDKITPPQDGSLLLVGTYSDQLAQFDSTASKKTWRQLEIDTSADRNYLVECLEDSGNHGSGTGNSNYIADGGSGFTSSVPNNPNVPHKVWSSGQGNLQLFAGNYINYLNDDTVPLEEKSYIEQVKTAVEILVRSNNRINIGLMRFDSGGEGGAVQYPIQDVASSRNDFFTRLRTLNASGITPLSEAYYEALLYFGGKDADYSLRANPGNQINNLTTLSGNTVFRSPISSTCDKNYLVVLSDGEPYYDYVNAERRGKLPGFNVGSCNVPALPTSRLWRHNWNSNAFSSDTATNDNCLDELAGWANTNDIAQVAGLDAHEGKQTLTSHMIGFALGNTGAVQLMRDAAEKGGGNFYEAEGEAGLISIFNEIIASTLIINTTFAAPAVSVNAFNRSTHLDDLYFTLFKPGEGKHWDGNLKKYKLKFRDVAGSTTKEPFIADVNGKDAIDDTGFFSEDSQDYWAAAGVSGLDVTAGGAANVLPTIRNVYTFTGTYASGGTPSGSGSLTSATNAVDPTNASLTDSMLNITYETSISEEIVSGTTFRDTLINWASGLDALSEHGVADTYSDRRLQMGDPLHSQPALVQYGANELVAYTATNDGYLHAFNTNDGEEIFSFIPQELLPNLKLAMENNGGNKLYGLDGDVVAWINDANGDGTISGASEHVYIYVTMRRGGKNIYALDVTNKNSPSLLWVIKGGAGDYDELGQTWSTVNVATVKDGSADKTVLIFGGGYDENQDTAAVTAEDDEGRTVYIADATTGKRLWTAGADASSPIDDMDYSIPARVSVIDSSGDGYVDRFYAADMGGQIFRFDIDNNNNAALGASIIGGRIADLADASTSPSNRTAENARRFYYPPDVALVDASEGAYHGLVISSGYRAHPLDVSTHDRIYMLKDRHTGAVKNESDYDVLTEANLHDATDNIAGGDGVDEDERAVELAKISGAEGWYISLDDEENTGEWLGEKGLAEALIIEGAAIVTTYTPIFETSGDSCTRENLGVGKVFYLDLLDATPAFPSNVDVRVERHTKLLRGGIPPSPGGFITKGNDATICVGTECQRADFGLGVRKTYWYER